MALVRRLKSRSKPGLLLVGTGLVISVWLACGGNSAPLNPNTPSPTPPVPAPPSQETVIFTGAGDIANCLTPDQGERVARLLDNIEGLIFTTGDNVYENGTFEEFQKCYTPTWGRHLARTRPSPGNHEYNTPGAAGYFQYFGELAGPPNRGYYSYDHGAWKVLSLNSQVPATPGSAQYHWVAQELKSSSARCTMAYWHHPVFSSGHDGNGTNMRAIFQLLFDNSADLVVVGHSHHYERFAPQDVNGRAMPGRGIRQFVVGTGGTYFTNITAIQPNSEVRDGRTNGVLKLTLAPTSYTWEFVPVAGATFRDSGSDVCF
jgi:hypothetical protein